MFKNSDCPLVQKMKLLLKKRFVVICWRLALPSLLAVLIVSILKPLGLIHANEGIYTAWAATCVTLTGIINAFYREQKRYEDIDGHSKSHTAIDEAIDLIRTIHNELRNQPINTEVGMNPLQPSAPTGGTNDVQN